MRSCLRELKVLRPSSVDEALDFLSSGSGSGSGSIVPLAGCTDVYVQLEFGQTPGSTYLDLWGLRELRGISVVDGDVLRIGALTTYTQMIRSPHVQRRLPMMIDAAKQVGGVQIQTRGTLGGNIANGSPAGDSLPVLAVCESVVITRSSRGERRIPFDSFYTGYRANVLASDELIVAVEIPPVEGKQWFRKVGTRQAQAISKIVMAGVRSDTPRVAIGSVAPTVVRVPRTEAALASGDIENAKRVLADEIKPIDDLRSTAEYRRKVAVNLLGKFWNDTTA